ncbi:ABC transporter permease [Propioniciclava soli]|uniref:Iron ABC transporter permease n=1 Tax=Propioniciclava soli TaxID=2775081 RepID=A0ABZ3C5H5_9ACTN|nr:iron ABC transporter permease [Propioniciclava soli]
MSSAVTVRPAPRRGWRADSFTGVRVIVWLVTAGVVLTPLAAMVALAVQGDQFALLGSEDVVVAARNSVVTSLASAIGAVAVGTYLAIVLDHTDLRGRAALRLFALSPMFIPPFVGAIAWLGVFGPTMGVNRVWSDGFGAPLWNIYGADGIIFLLTVHSYPLAYLIIGAALRRIPSDLEQAARIAGASGVGALRDVTIPLLRPALVASFTLTFVSNLADFGIPAIIGLPERYYTLATLIYRSIQSGTVAAPLSVVSTIGVALLAMAVVAALLDARVNRQHTELDSTAVVRHRLDLAGARLPLSALTWLAALAITVLPIVALATQAVLPAPGVPLAWEHLTLDNFGRALGLRSTQVGVRNSLMLAGLAAAICAVLGLLVGLVTTRTRARGNALLNGLAILPQAIPGTVIAVGWLIVAPTLGLFNTPWLILVAYVMAFLALVVQAVSAPLRGIPVTLEEAARASGATQTRALFDIALRLAIPAAVTGGAMVFLTAVRELTISALLRSPGTQTLGVAIFDLQQAGNYNASSALSLLVTIVGLLGIALLAGRERN